MSWGVIEKAIDANWSRGRSVRALGGAHCVAAGRPSYGFQTGLGRNTIQPMTPRHWLGIASSSLAMVAALAQAAYAGPAVSFDTPEAAVDHFVKSIAAGDLDGAMQALAVDERVAGAGARRPSKSRTFARVHKMNLVAESASETRRFVYALLLDDGMDDKMTEATDANIDRFIRAADPARLRALKIVRIDQPLQSAARTAKAIEMAREHAAREGADDSTERIALFQLGGKHYRGGFGLLRYGKSWRINRLSSYYTGGGPHERPVRTTTPEEYQALTK